MKIVFTTIINHLKDNEAESDGFPLTNTPNMAQNLILGLFGLASPILGLGS